MKEFLLLLLAVPIALSSVLSQQLAGFIPPRVAPSMVTVRITPIVIAPLAPTPTPGTPPIIVGFLTDADRYALARAAGWGPTEAIIATAISIAEDGSGDPSALSPPNTDGSRDLGAWQINSAHWASCSGQQALTAPLNNAQCAIGIYRRQGWCAWSTYGDLQTCGIRGHDNSYAKYLGRARAVSGG